MDLIIKVFWDSDKDGVYEPLAGASVKDLPPSYRGGMNFPTARTDSSGNFAFTGAEEGLHTLCAYPYSVPAYNPNDTCGTVTVAGGYKTRVELFIPPGNLW